MKKLIISTAFILISLGVHAQYEEKDSNRIGISGGINQFTLNTSNFDASPGTGFNAGLSVRGNFYNDFDMVYGMQFSENNFTVKAVDAAASTIDYKLQSAQIYLLLSYKFIENHLSVEFGPMLQVNGKAQIGDKTTDSGKVINANGLLAGDITDMPRLNFYPTIGITAGVRHFRANVSYQYGVNNILGKAESSGAPENLKGHAGILSGNLIIYL